MALGVAGHDTGGEESAAGGRADVAQQVACLDIVAAEAPGSAEIALDERNVVAVPELADDIAIEIQRKTPVAIHLEDGAAQFLRADEQIIRHCVAPEKRLAVIRRVGLRVCPVVVALGDGKQPLDGEQLAFLRAGCLGKGLPVRFIQEKQLGRLGNREDFDAPSLPEVALGEIIVDICGTFVRCQIAADINDQPQLVQRIGGVGVGGEDVRHRCRADFSLGGLHDAGFQFGHAALAVRLNNDALFLADRFVEGFDERVETIQQCTVVVCPDRNADGLRCNVIR